MLGFCGTAPATLYIYIHIYNGFWNIIVAISLQIRGLFVCKLISVSLFPCKLLSMQWHTSPIWFLVSWIINSVNWDSRKSARLLHFQQNGHFHFLCLICDILHGICFKCIMFLFFSIFCRYQNCVYTYRILPNEDKKLSVQVKK